MDSASTPSGSSMQYTKTGSKTGSSPCFSNPRPSPGNVFESPAGYTLAGYADGILLLERQGKYGYYHKDGYWLAQPIYTYAQPFMEGLGVIGFAGGKVGAIDVAGNVVIPFTYEYISAPSSGLMAVFSKKDGWSVLVKVVPERSEA